MGVAEHEGTDALSGGCGGVDGVFVVGDAGGGELVGCGEVGVDALDSVGFLIRDGDGRGLVR